jgi:hypothetical protein
MQSRSTHAEACDLRSSSGRVALKVMTIVLTAVSFLGCTAGVALGVVGGTTVSIAAAPWTVFVRENGQPRCTGVIIDESQILTAGHCVMSRNGNSANPLPASDFTVEAGVSNFRHPLNSDHPQVRSVIAVRAMPGYIAASKETPSSYLSLVARDLAILTLSSRLDLRGADARAASIPTVDSHLSRGAERFVAAGFGVERPKGYYENGTLNEVLKSTLRSNCGTSQVLCVFQSTGPCFGDSGSGIVDVQSRPTVIGIASQVQPGCGPGLTFYVLLASRAALRFVHGTMRSSYIDRISDGPADTHTAIRPLPAIGIVCVILGVLGVWRIRHRKERMGR